MSKISVLDDHLTNMIAAGEVVERPMGVVKELVENSIDAQATKIEIYLQNGGLDCIEIVDDGCGMDKTDATVAFQRHATSKISQINDLWKISTMGFRGEALPSIASVSKVTMQTCDGNDSTLVRIEYGKIIEARPIACSQGTTIKVEGLFYKTPARLKHLKSGNVEANLIFDLIQKIALAHPEISFTLYSDEKIRLLTNGSSSLQETIMSVYGIDVAKKCIPIDFTDYDFRVEGFVVAPSITRSNRQYINTSMNGRIIRSLSLQKAIIDGYHSFIMPDRFPIVVLNIVADYQLIDVNVHPSKWEIRISKEKQLYSLITEKISETLRQHMIPNDLLVEHVTAVKPSVEIYDTEKNTLLNEETVEYKKDPVVVEVKEETKVVVDTTEDNVQFVQPNIIPKKEKYIQQTIDNYSDEPTLERFIYLGQFHGKYILAYDEDTMYIIDQHAAMERCQYEEIQNDIINRSVSMQSLLVPLVINLTASQMNSLDRINEILSCINVTVEQFSINSVVVREIPVFVEEGMEEKFIIELIDEISNDKNMDVLDIRKEKIASLACHSSVKFNTFMSADEAKKLLSRLSKCVQPFNCPHGRPTMISIKDYQLQKEFKRV